MLKAIFNFSAYFCIFLRVTHQVFFFKPQTFSATSLQIVNPRTFWEMNTVILYINVVVVLVHVDTWIQLRICNCFVCVTFSIISVIWNLFVLYFYDFVVFIYYLFPPSFLRTPPYLDGCPISSVISGIQLANTAYAHQHT